MNYKILMFSLVSLLSITYKAYSMESVIESNKVQVISKSERKINQIISELKALDLGNVRFHWTGFEKLVKKILRHVSSNINYDSQFYVRLKRLHKDIKSKKSPVVKVEMFNNFIFTNFTAGLLELINDYSPEEMKQNSIDAIQELLPKIISKLINEDIDLFDNLLIYVQENKLNNFEQDFLSYPQSKNLDEAISLSIKQSNVKDLIELVEKNYDDVIRLNLINNTYTFGINKFAILEVILKQILDIRQILDKKSSNFNNLNNLFLKLINEPNLSIFILIKLKNELQFKIELAEKDPNYEHAIGFQLDLAQTYFDLISRNLRSKTI